MKARRSLVILTLVAVASISACKKKTPGGSGSPTPGPGATPTPGPAQRYPGAPSSCQSIPFHTHGRCEDKRNTTGVESHQWVFVGELEGAINSVNRADLVDETGGIRAGQEGTYANRLSEYLNTHGICAVRDGDRTMFLQSDDADYSEILEFLNGRTRRPSVYPNIECAPAGHLPGVVKGYPCAIPEIPNKTCVGPQNRYFDLVSGVIREIVSEERPKGPLSELIDFRFSPDDPSSIDQLLKDDGVRFMWRVAEKLSARGYCVSHDNWKHVRVRNGEFEEEVGIVTSQGIPGRNAAKDQACIETGFTDATCEYSYVRVWETCKTP